MTPSEQNDMRISYLVFENEGNLCALATNDPVYVGVLVDAYGARIVSLSDYEQVRAAQVKRDNLAEGRGL